MLQCRPGDRTKDGVRDDPGRTAAHHSPYEGSCCAAPGTRNRFNYFKTYSKKGISMIRVAFVIGDYPPDQRRLREDTARSYSSAEVEVGILSVPACPFDGLTPAEIQAAAPLF